MIHCRVLEILRKCKSKMLSTYAAHFLIRFLISHWGQFLKIPGNNECCDCRNPEPRWASINLGITLCISCSGVHRSLGVHHSKVRSLTLDAWEPEIVKVMMELGNQIVNRVYEARVDESVQRATDHCDDGVREAWIKAKYVEKRFVVPILDNNVTSDKEATLPEDNGSSIMSSKPLVARRWSVRRLRRRPKTKSRTSSTNRGNDSSSMAVREEDNNSVKSSSSGSSILVVGKDLCDTLLKDELALSSDQESTGGEDDNGLGTYTQVIYTFICNPLVGKQ